MFIKIGIGLLSVLILLMAALYVLVFVRLKKRKRIPFDPSEEKERAKNYPPAYPNGWFSLCSADAVGKGKVIEVNALGHKLAVFRGQDGKVGVMDAYCPHLNANLADGKVVDNQLVCPFHGWQFNTTGKCTKVPYSEKLPQNNEPSRWIIKEDWGLILMWHHANGEAPTWSTDGALPEIKQYKFLSKTSDTLRIHLQDFAENGADFAHFNFIHNLITIPLANKLVDVQHTVNIEFGEGDIKHQAWFTDQADLVWKKSRKMIPHAGGHAKVTFFGPGFLVFNFTTEIGNMMLLKTFTPMGPLKVRMDDYIYAPKGTFPLAVKYLVGEASAQFHDDMNIWERKNFAIRPQLVKGDGPIMKMRAWYSQFYSKPEDVAKANMLSGEVADSMVA